MILRISLFGQKHKQKYIFIIIIFIINYRKMKLNVAKTNKCPDRLESASVKWNNVEDESQSEKVPSCGFRTLISVLWYFFISVQSKEELQDPGMNTTAAATQLTKLTHTHKKKEIQIFTINVTSTRNSTETTSPFPSSLQIYSLVGCLETGRDLTGFLKTYRHKLTSQGRFEFSV